jgi:hypothetical protein
MKPFITHKSWKQHAQHPPSGSYPQVIDYMIIIVIIQQTQGGGKTFFATKSHNILFNFHHLLIGRHERE